MVDTMEFEVFLKRRKVTKLSLSKDMKLSWTCLNNKVKNETEFKGSEIAYLIQRFGTEIVPIIFCGNVSLQETLNEYSNRIE